VYDEDPLTAISLLVRVFQDVQHVPLSEEEHDLFEAGVNVTDSVWPAPAHTIVPAAGEYAQEPDTVVVAFSCVALNAVA
jgi:hypothetical protein